MLRTIYREATVVIGWNIFGGGGAFTNGGIFKTNGTVNQRKRGQIGYFAWINIVGRTWHQQKRKDVFTSLTKYGVWRASKPMRYDVSEVARAVDRSEALHTVAPF